VSKCNDRKDRELDLELPEYMTKGGPGDKSGPGVVDTSNWFKGQLDPTNWNYRPFAIEEGSIGQQAKDQEIFFCDIPFTQLYMEMSGNYSACCFGAQADGQYGLPDHNVKNTTLKEWMLDSDYMNQIRKEMLDPKSDLKMVSKTCWRCIADEKRYGRSRRTACMKIHTQDAEFWDAIERSVLMFKATGRYEFEERIIEVQLKVYGDECNLDCYMCLHTNSSTRQQVAKKGVWSDEIFGETAWSSAFEGGAKKTFTKKNVEDMIQQTIDLAPFIRSIKIIGGEPLIMKKHYELLQRLIDIGEAKNIFIKYQTNFTETKAGKHNIFNYVPHFRNVSMVASVDGVGKTIEYMRRRTDWNKVLENVEICKKYPNIVVDFNGLVSFLSVMRFYEVIDYCLERPQLVDQINWAMLDNPVHLRVNNLPEKIKQNLIPKYEKWPDIQAALRKPADEEVNIQDTFQYLLKQDNFYKGTKWESHLFEVFPELEEFYDPMYKHNANLDLNIKKQEDIL
tara:strand:+ start:3398 stop:4918 length:1521 start_codon:yes stop_codon:yes gene_type:complete